MAYCEKVKCIKILLVDEDDKLTDQIGKILQEKNFECVVSNEIGAGLMMILEQKFDIVVLDLNMLTPLSNDMVEFLAIIRKLNEQKLILTAKLLPNKDLMLEIMKNRFDAFLVKPLNVETLCDIINRKNRSSSETNVNTTFDN
jgi:DNA-binding response OmpR family regulator